MLKIGKRTFYVLWGLFIAFLIVSYFQNPEIAKPEQVRGFIQAYGNEMMLVYIILTLVRGFFMIPSTPFVIAGGMLFPNQLLLVLTISMIGVLVSATSLYYFSDMLGFSNYLEKKYPNGINKWKNRLKSPKAILLTTGWSFFPFVPTDLICYVAGIVKMPYKYLFIGVFTGELVLDVFYVCFGAQI